MPLISILTIEYPRYSYALHFATISFTTAKVNGLIVLPQATPWVMVINSEAYLLIISLTCLPNALFFHIQRSIGQIGNISIVPTIKPRGSEINAPLKFVNNQYSLFFLCLLSSRTVVSFRFASRQPATPGFTSIWKMNGV